jgi:hypothetical protein
MSRYARIESQQVAEIIIAPEGIDITRMFPADIVAACVSCPAEVREGWSYDGAAFSPPPPPTEAELKAQRRAEILSRLAALDIESIRPLRAVADDTASDFDRQKLASLETEASGLREGLQEVSNA